jgi:hypothetical protein
MRFAYVITGILLYGFFMIAGCSKEASLQGKWSRDDDAIVIQLHEDHTGMITADNIKIYNKKGISLPSDILLKQTMKCKWSLQEGNNLKIEDLESAGQNILNLKFDGNTLSKDGKIVYTRKAE